MLEAQDKEQVLKWSERQLGVQARLVSVSEKDFLESEAFIEKGGTGITAREAEGCQPVMSIMANFIEPMLDAEDRHMDGDGRVSGPLFKGARPTVH